VERFEHVGPDIFLKGLHDSLVIGFRRCEKTKRCAKRSIAYDGPGRIELARQRLGRFASLADYGITADRIAFQSDVSATAIPRERTPSSQIWMFL
jgi:hypothetical protein